tara:strand:+ start:995 stop:1366 length:372 start_codon:yes stop_codon:yes gene_type:complete
MSNFECSVKDLMSQSEAKIEKETVKETVTFDPLNVEYNEKITNENSPDVKLSMYQKLYTDKNIKMVMFVTLVYLVLNSEQMYTFISNNLPVLFVDGSPGFLGKSAIGFILGIIIIVFTSFFSF